MCRGMGHGTQQQSLATLDRATGHCKRRGYGYGESCRHDRAGLALQTERQNGRTGVNTLRSLEPLARLASCALRLLHDPSSSLVLPSSVPRLSLPAPSSTSHIAHCTAFSVHSTPTDPEPKAQHTQPAQPVSPPASPLNRQPGSVVLTQHFASLHQKTRPRATYPALAFLHISLCTLSPLLLTILSPPASFPRHPSCALPFVPPCTSSWATEHPLRLA